MENVSADEKPAAMQHFNRTIWDGELNNNSLSATGTTTSNNSSNIILSIFYLKIILICTYTTCIGNILFTIPKSPRLYRIIR